MPPRPFTAEMAVDLRLPSEPRLSPDGSLVAYCVAPVGHPTTDRISAIHVAAIDGSSAPHALTGNLHNNVAPRWSPDGRSIAFLSDRVKRGEVQVWRVNVSGGEPLSLTSIEGGAANPSWTPDGRYVVFTARRDMLAGVATPDSEIKVASGQWRPHTIARVPASGGAPAILGPAEGHVWTFELDPAGTRIAAFVSPTEDLAGTWDNLNLVVIDADGRERQLTRFNGFASRISWSPDGRLLTVVSAQIPNAGDTRVFVVDVETGDVHALPSGEMTPGAALFQGHDLIVQRVEGQRSRVDRTDPRGSEWDRLDLGPAANDAWVDAGVNLDVGEHALAFICGHPRRPFDVFAAHRGGPARCLTSLNPQLEDVELSDMQPLEWRSADGLRVEGWLLLPPGNEEQRPLPLVVEVHGGPTWQWGNWFHGTWHDIAQMLAARGFAVLLPNPRGSTGRGGAFVDGNRYDFGGRDFADIMAGIDLLVARGIADPARLGICGWSYGGFMTAWAVTQTDRFRAAVAGAAPTNWVSKIGTTDIGPYNEWNLGRVRDEPDRPWERSPVRYISRVRTPTLLVHGEADRRVPVTQGLEFYLGLKSAGVETELVTYPRQAHAFHERAFQLDLLKRTCAWFERFLI